MQKAIIDGALNGVSEHLNDLVRDAESFKKLTGKDLPLYEDGQALISKAIASVRKVLTTLDSNRKLDNVFPDKEAFSRAVDQQAMNALNAHAKGIPDRVIVAAAEAELMSSEQLATR